MDILTIIGILGTATILLAFVLNQTHVWRDTDMRYDAANAAGSIVLVVYAWLLGSWPFIILNTVWALVSLRDVLKKIQI